MLIVNKNFLLFIFKGFTVSFVLLKILAYFTSQNGLWLFLTTSKVIAVNNLDFLKQYFFIQ